MMRTSLHTLSSTDTDFENRIVTYVGKTISGEKFSALFSDILFVKLTNESEIHNGYQYHDGFNSDMHEFSHDKDCSKGGFYFTTKNYAYKWINYRNDLMYHMRQVNVPYNAKVYIESFCKFKTDNFILWEREPIDIDIYVRFCIAAIYESRVKPLCEAIRDRDFYLKIVKFNGNLLQFIPYELRDVEICVEAINNYSYASTHVPPSILEKIELIA